MVYLAQGRDSFYAALGEKKRPFADGLMSLFHHRVFHALGSAADAEYASSLLGKRLETSFGGQVRPPEDVFEGVFGHLWGQSQVHTSFNESWQPVLQPAVFMNGLRCGGEENGGIVDAIVVRSGERFSNGQNWIHVSFQQR